MKHKIDWIARFLCSCLVSAVFFVVASPSVLIYLFFFDVVWLLVLFCYGNFENNRFLANGLIVSAGCTAAFVLVKLLTGRPFRAPAYWEAVLLGIGVVEAVIAITLSEREERSGPVKPDLYAERVYDLSRVRDYILQFQIIGLDAQWGQGKTFLLNYLKEDPEIRKTFEIIQIDLLSCDLDAVETILVEELEKVFQKSHIYPGSSHRLKSLLGKNQWTSVLGGLVVGDSTGLSAAFDDLRQEVDKLEKGILILFEDVDRIFDRDTIQKVFAISEKLSGEQLHIVFQYDICTLEDKGFTRDYLEKYIPYTVNLTEITFEKLVRYQWDELGMERTPLDRKKVCEIPQILSGSYEINQVMGTNIDAGIRLREEATPRKVGIFLSELKGLLASNKELAQENSVDTVSRVLFVKHFFYSYYAKLYIGESPLQSWTFCESGKTYTMPELLAKYRKPDKNEGEEDRQKRLQALQTVLEAPENRCVWVLTLMLGYELQIEQIERNLSEIATEPVQNLRKKEKNEKIDRIVWNVLANGTSELTDAENAIQKLQQEVLTKTGAEQERAWEAYENDMFYERLRSGNRTVFRWGVDPYLPLFRAMEILPVSEKEREDFLTFYFSQYQKAEECRTISTGLIDNLNYCSTRGKKIFFKITSFFNRLEVAGNLNNDKSYRIFLKEYMGAVATYGCCQRVTYWEFQLTENVSEHRHHVETLLEELRKELCTLREKWTQTYVKEDYQTLICFVEKNLELIRNPIPRPERGPSVRVRDTKTQWVHQEEVDRLIALKKEKPKRFDEELEKSYRAGKIYLREMEAILNEK